VGGKKPANKIDKAFVIFMTQLQAQPGIVAASGKKRQPRPVKKMPGK
jgi:hypothetical protein